MDSRGLLDSEKVTAGTFYLESSGSGLGQGEFTRSSVLSYTGAS